MGNYTDKLNLTTALKKIKAWAEGKFKPKVLNEKTYDAYTCSANDTANGVLFFLKVTLNDTTNWAAPWRVKYRLTVTTSEANTRGVYECDMGANASTVTYYNQNNFYSGDYRPIHNHALIYPKSGYSDKGAYVGVRTYSSRNVTSLARVYKIEVLEVEGCTVEILDSITKYSALYNSTYYYYGEYTGSSQGLWESSDSDTITQSALSVNYVTVGGTLRLAHGCMFGYDRNNNAIALSAYNSSYTSYTTSINTARVYSTTGIDWTRGLHYPSSWTNYAVGAIMTTADYTMYTAVDLRYSDNNIPATSANNLGMVAYKAVYIRGVIKSDGLFYVAPLSVTYNSATYKRAWTQTVPTAVETDSDGNQYMYWYVGEPYHDSYYANSLYRVNLRENNPMYWFHNGRFEMYVPKAIDADKVNGHTVNADVPSGAKFTDTTYESKAAASGGTAVSLVTTGEKYTWNNKQDAITSSNKIPYSNISGTPTIPSAVTESTVSGWGFTKNTGTVTSVKLNGTTYSPSSGVVDLGTINSGLPQLELNTHLQNNTVPTAGVYELATPVRIFYGYENTYAEYTVKGVVSILNRDSTSFYLMCPYGEFGFRTNYQSNGDGVWYPINDSSNPLMPYNDYIYRRTHWTDIGGYVAMTDYHWSGSGSNTKEFTITDDLRNGLAGLYLGGDYDVSASEIGDLCVLENTEDGQAVTHSVVATTTSATLVTFSWDSEYFKFEYNNSGELTRVYGYVTNGWSTYAFGYRDGDIEVVHELDSKYIKSTVDDLEEQISNKPNSIVCNGGDYWPNEYGEIDISGAVGIEFIEYSPNDGSKTPPTKADIDSILESNKTVVCKYYSTTTADPVYYYLYGKTTSGYTFFTTHGTIMFRLQCGSSGWTSTRYNVVSSVKVNGTTYDPSTANGALDLGTISGSGTVTSIKLNGTTYSPTSGVVDLGTVSGGGVTPSDYVIETGTSGIWTYEKWNGGKYECWGKVTTTGKLNNSNAGGYNMATAITVENYPITFIEAPIISMTGYTTDGTTVIPVIPTSTTPTTNTGKINLWRGNSNTSTSTKTVTIHAIGKWK